MIQLYRVAATISMLAMVACGSAEDEFAGRETREGSDGKSTTVIASDGAAAGTDGSGPREESVVVELDGRHFDASRITECPATPGHSLGFNAQTEDYVGPRSDQGLRVGGGFEQGRGRVVAEYRGKQWNAAGDAGSSLTYDLTDSRFVDAEGWTHRFVTVKATGTLSDDAASTLPFGLVVTCEPGGT